MKLRFYLPILLIFLLGTVPRAFALDPKEVVGNYELTGAFEMAGLLMMKADQKYTAGFTYGAADWTEEGIWKIQGDEIVLEGARFKVKNQLISNFFLPSGTRFKYKDGKLAGTDPARKLSFVDPNKTPSPKKKTADSAGEGRMRVKGSVVKRDADYLVVKTGKECMHFDVHSLSESVLKVAQVGKSIDVEIPYSSIIGGGSCP